jgi:hypothetical protein
MTRRAEAVTGALLLVGLLAAPAVAAPDMRGVALGLYDDGDRSSDLAEIAALGADTVSLVVSWKQHDVRSVELAAAPGATIPDERVREVIRAAHKAHLKVFLFPIVEVEIRRPLEWRGTIKPDDISRWWLNYEAFILHYAAIAGEESADLFAVGSELVSTESWRDRWYHLISGVKKRYKGKLVYSANWDHYEQVSFWDRVDYVGVTAYNELTKSKDASEPELAAAWRAVREALVAFASKVQRPLIITEIGYTSQDGAAVHPWDYTLRAPIDLEEQRRCYAAFVSAWRDEPRLAGVFFWQWYGDGGPSDGSYTPRGKPAEKVLKEWYSQR